MLRTVPVLLSLLLLASCVATARRPPSAHLTHGVAIGEVDATSAIAWGRCDRAAVFTVECDPAPAHGGARHSAEVAAAHDFTGAVAIRDLRPATTYHYRAWCGDGEEEAVGGQFRTAPAATDAA